MISIRFLLGASMYINELRPGKTERLQQEEGGALYRGSVTSMT